MKVTTTIAAIGVILLAGAACSSEEPAAREAACVAPQSTDLTTADGWLNLVRGSDNVSLKIDNGRGERALHRADEQQPLASAVKVVHLAAYSRAVAAGTLNPEEQIPLGEWERWYIPGTDGGAHPAALERLGIPGDIEGATDKAATARLDDLVSAMVRESDNAAPDYLRFRLGDSALVDAAAAGGWDGFRAPTLTGSTLSILAPSLANGDLWDVANKWAFDTQFKDGVTQAVTQLPPFDEQAKRVADHSAAGSADQLSSLLRSFADGSFGEGSDVALRQIEWIPADAGELGVGYKGGNLPGVLTQAFEVRRTDGTVATAVWLVDGLTEARYTEALNGLEAFQTLIIDAMSDDATLGKIACVV